MKPATVSEYIAQAPAAQRPKLKQLRGLIKKAAPKAEEKISYGMAYYGYQGRLAYFAPAKNHLGFYIMPPMVEKFKRELKNYSANGATVRFPWDKKLPTALITKMVKARVKWNEAKAAKKKPAAIL